MKNIKSLAQIEDLVLNFLIAGRDTTAQAMSWCLHLVMQHPSVLQRRNDTMKNCELTCVVFLMVLVIKQALRELRQDAHGDSAGLRLTAVGV